MISVGTAPVVIVALGADRSKPSTDSRMSQKPSIDYYSGNFTFQIGAFKNKDNAIRLKRKLEERYLNVHITEYDTGQDILYRVRIGKASSLEEAVAFENKLLQDGFKDVFIIAE